MTHYPSFVTPYSVFPTAVREMAIMESFAKGVEAAAASIGCSARTILRMRNALGGRLGELVAGVAGLIMRLDPLWPLSSVQGNFEMAFVLLHRARDLLEEEGPLLAVGRRRPTWPSALPVFA